MAIKQTRRTVSLNRAVAERLKAHCARRGVPVSKYVQRTVEAAMDRELLTERTREIAERARKSGAA